MSPLAAATFPEIFVLKIRPVDVRHVLAYSCAAARDSHPLPISDAESLRSQMRANLVAEKNPTKLLVRSMYRAALAPVKSLLRLPFFAEPHRQRNELAASMSGIADNKLLV